VVEAVEQYMSVATKLNASPPRAWLTQQSQGLPHAAYRMINGIVATQTIGDWFFTWYDKAPGLRWDVAPMPFSPHTKKTASTTNLVGVVMSPIAQNRDLAWAWMASLMKQGVQDRVPA